MYRVVCMYWPLMDSQRMLKLLSVKNQFREQPHPLLVINVQVWMQICGVKTKRIHMDIIHCLSVTQNFKGSLRTQGIQNIPWFCKYTSVIAYVRVSTKRDFKNNLKPLKKVLKKIAEEIFKKIYKISIFWTHRSQACLGN